MVDGLLSTTSSDFGIAAAFSAFIIGFDSDVVDAPSSISLGRDLARLGVVTPSGPSFGEIARGFVLGADGRWRSTTSDPETTASTGERLFREEGEPTEALQRIIAFVGEYSDAAKATAAFTAELKALDLFQTINIEIRSPDRATSNFSGFAAVSEERLNALPDEAWLDLRRKGYLAPIYAHLISLMNFALLGERPQ